MDLALPGDHAPAGTHSQFPLPPVAPALTFPEFRSNFIDLSEPWGAPMADQNPQDSQNQDPHVDEALEGLDQGKRETLTRLIRGSAFAAPVVASFAMQGLSIKPADAQTPGASFRSSNSTVSDVRLKRDIARADTHPLGFGIYQFKYLWSDVSYVGVIAQEVLEKAPDAVTVGPGGYLSVDYGALGIEMTRADVRAS